MSFTGDALGALGLGAPKGPSQEDIARQIEQNRSQYEADAASRLVADQEAAAAAAADRARRRRGTEAFIITPRDTPGTGLFIPR
jgi:hypothetical protein